MVRRLGTAMIALLLAGVLLAGQCAACPLFLAAFQKAPSQGCCKPSGQCHRPTPQSPGAKNCSQRNAAVANFDKPEVAAAARLASAPVLIALPQAPVLEPTLALQADNVISHGPPDLSILHATLLL